MSDKINDPADPTTWVAHHPHPPWGDEPKPEPEKVEEPAPVDEASPTVAAKTAK